MNRLPIPIFNLSLHFKFWDFIADNPGMLKREVINLCRNSNKFSNDEIQSLSDSIHNCLACDYATDLNKYVNNYPDIKGYSNLADTNSCNYCPFFQEDKPIKEVKDCLNGVFLAWVENTDAFKKAQNPKDKAKFAYKNRLLAHTIRDWEVKAAVKSR